MVETKKRDWLDIGGRSYVGFGAAKIEVRVASDGNAWSWRDLTEAEKEEILRHMSQWGGQ